VYKHQQNYAFLLAYVTMGIVGLGSFLFHATLTYSMQLMDELPMIYTVAVLTYTIIEADSHSRKPTAYLKPLLIIDSLLVTIIYLLFPYPIIHHMAYGIHLVIITVSFTKHFMKLRNSPYKNSLRNLIIVGWGMHALGFICWNIDNVMCHSLRSIRALIGPFAFLLQMHGWWHVWTGIGSYAYIVGNQYLCILLEGREDEFLLKWKYGIPRINHVGMGERGGWLLVNNKWMHKKE